MIVRVLSEQAERPPRLTYRSAAVCAFSVPFRMTQRDADRAGTCRAVAPSCGPPACTAPANPPRRSVGPAPAGVKVRWMIPGWRPSLSPGPSRVSRHPVVPESLLEPRRHPGILAGLPFTPCAVNRDQLHCQECPARAACMTDEDARALPARSTTAAPPRPGPVGRQRAQPVSRAGRAGPGRPGRFPCSLRFARRRRSPALPLRHRHGYPAALHRGLRPDIHKPAQEFPVP